MSRSERLGSPLGRGEAKHMDLAWEMVAEIRETKAA